MTKRASSDHVQNKRKREESVYQLLHEESQMLTGNKEKTVIQVLFQFSFLRQNTVYTKHRMRYCGFCFGWLVFPPNLVIYYGFFFEILHNPNVLGLR